MVECDQTMWDLNLNQTLAAVRFHISEATGYSLFYMVYNRQVILPMDQLLAPRRKHLGEHTLGEFLQRQHRAFVRVHRRMKKNKQKQSARANKNVSPMDFKVGDCVFLKRHVRENKLQSKWKSHYVILEQMSPVTFRIKNQLTGKVEKSHAQHLRKANLEWPDHERSIKGRSATLAVSPESTDSESEIASEKEVLEKGDEEMEGDFQDFQDFTRTSFPNAISDSVSEEPNKVSEEKEENSEDIPLARLCKKRVRSSSSEEENIPLHELQRRLRHRRLRQEESDPVEVSFDQNVTEQLVSNEHQEMNSQTENEYVSAMSETE